MDRSTKVKINKAVKQIKKMRSGKKAPERATFPYQVSDRTERFLMTLGLAAGAAVFFDGSRRKKKKIFFRRVKANYDSFGNIVDSTVAKQLTIDEKREFKDDVLERMQIEKAVKFEL